MVNEYIDGSADHGTYPNNVDDFVKEALPAIADFFVQLILSTESTKFLFSTSKCCICNKKSNLAFYSIDTIATFHRKREATAKLSGFVEIGDQLLSMGFYSISDSCICEACLVPIQILPEKAKLRKIRDRFMLTGKTHYVVQQRDKF